MTTREDGTHGDEDRDHAAEVARLRERIAELEASSQQLRAEYRDVADALGRCDWGDGGSYIVASGEELVGRVRELHARIAELEAQAGDVDAVARAMRAEAQESGCYCIELTVLVDGRVEVRWQVGESATLAYCHLDDPERLPSRVLGVRR